MRFRKGRGGGGEPRPDSARPFDPAQDERNPAPPQVMDSCVGARGCRVEGRDSIYSLVDHGRIRAWLWGRAIHESPLRGGHPPPLILREPQHERPLPSRIPFRGTRMTGKRGVARIPFMRWFAWGDRALLWGRAIHESPLRGGEEGDRESRRYGGRGRRKGMVIRE